MTTTEEKMAKYYSSSVSLIVQWSSASVLRALRLLEETFMPIVV